MPRKRAVRIYLCYCKQEEIFLCTQVTHRQREGPLQALPRQAHEIRQETEEGHGAVLPGMERPSANFTPRRHQIVGRESNLRSYFIQASYSGSVFLSSTKFYLQHANNHYENKYSFEDTDVLIP